MTTDAGTDAADSSAVDPEAGRFYVLDADYRGEGPFYGLDFVNKEVVLAGYALLRPTKSGKFDLPAKPLLVHVPERGGLPRDFESGIGGCWLVSDRLKVVMESVDPSGFAFFPCDLRLSDGSPGPLHYICEVVRTLDALDEDRSEVDITIDDDYVNGKVYEIYPGVRLIFDQNATRGAHVFYTPFAAYVFCDKQMHDTIVAHGFSGMEFRDAAKY